MQCELIISCGLSQPVCLIAARDKVIGYCFCISVSSIIVLVNKAMQPAPPLMSATYPIISSSSLHSRRLFNSSAPFCSVTLYGLISINCFWFTDSVDKFALSWEMEAGRARGRARGRGRLEGEKREVQRRPCDFPPQPVRHFLSDFSFCKSTVFSPPPRPNLNSFHPFFIASIYCWRTLKFQFSTN